MSILNVVNLNHGFGRGRYLQKRPQALSCFIYHGSYQPHFLFLLFYNGAE